jgi:hypothetical protein
MQRTSRLSIAPVLLAVSLVLAGCAQRPPAVLTAEERVLLDGLTRDPFIQVDSTVREDDGFLTVRTRQGNVIGSYRFMPSDDAVNTLSIRRIDERQELPVVWTPGVGTGPERRGLPAGR